MLQNSTVIRRLLSPPPEVEENCTCSICRRMVADYHLDVSVDAWPYPKRRYVCGSCHTLYLSNCRRCHLVTPQWESDDGGYCRTCASRHICSACGERDGSCDSYNTTSGRMNLCVRCVRSMPKCKSCSNRVKVPDDGETAYGVTVCQSCIDGMMTFEKIISNYTTNVAGTLFADRDDLLFGVELELVMKQNVNRGRFFEVWKDTMSVVEGNALLKFDRSIDYRRDEDGQYSPYGYKGFEVVTRPMSFKNQLDFWKRFMQYRPPRLEVQDTCGLHIHMTRDYFSELELGKWLVFVANAKNRLLIETIARRSHSQFAAFHPKKLTDGKQDKWIYANHYDALNINPARTPTIELRIFASTLEYWQMKASLQFVRSVSSFVRETGHCDLSYENYLRYLQIKHRSRFRELKQLISTNVRLREYLEDNK
jgi:hypothetical protein